MSDPQMAQLLPKEEQKKLKYAQFSQHKDLDVQESQIKSIRCFSTSFIKYLLFLILSLLSCGTLNLLCYWSPLLKARIQHKACRPKEANYLTIINQDGNQENVKIKTVKLETDCTVSNQKLSGTIRIFKYRFLNYYYDLPSDSFLPIYYESQQKFKELWSKDALEEDQVEDYKEIFGKCQMKIKVPNILVLLKKEVLHPFYIFQAFAFVLWMFEGYIIYGFCIILMSFISCSINLYETRRNLINLRQMALQTTTVTILRQHNWTLLPNTELIPGDLIKIQEQKVPCDIVLLQGQAIVDESTLTGESFPVVKDSIPNTEQIYKIDQYRQHTLFEGTHVIQVRGETVGLVIRTGFSTTKGKLIRGIMFPKPNNFTFHVDSFKFVFVMLLLALVGLTITIVIFIEKGIDIRDVIIRSLDLIVITVPPALPMAMTVGTSFAISRLKTKQITCISPPKVKVAGKVDIFAFDKTGTLTIDGMEIIGIKSVDQNGEFNPKIQQIKKLNNLLLEYDLQEQETNSKPNLQLKLLQGLAVCHSLNIVRGMIIGDTLELKMFQATGWKLETSQQQQKSTIIPIIEDRELKEQIEVHRIFHFDSKLKRMGIIVKNSCKNSVFHFFQKGACEAIVSNCLQNTIPQNLQHIYKSYTQAGYRVLALAYKQMHQCPDLQKVEMLEVESQLIFLGLLILHNPLKAETADAISTLHQANIRTLISTGDDVLTAIAIAKESGVINILDTVHVGEFNYEGNLKWTIYKPNLNLDTNEEAVKQGASIATTIELGNSITEEKFNDTNEWYARYRQMRDQGQQMQLAIVGDAFSHLLKTVQEEDQENQIVLNLLIKQGKIFARMTPEHKTQLVCAIQDTGVLVGMCGDGANDCGALKQADVGISLSQADASIAAPFTSKIENIGCTITVLKEGRCALVTSFQCFKFMAMYGLIQFTTVTLLYIIVSGLGDYQFLWIDLPHVVPLAIFMGYQGPYRKLVAQQPVGALISFPVLSSIFGQVFIQVVSQSILIFALLPTQDWFDPIDPQDNDYTKNFECQENTALFVYSLFIYLNIAIAFSEGKPFRHTTLKNIRLLVTYTILFVLDFYILLYPAGWTRDVLQLKQQSHFTWKLIFIISVATHLLIASAYERWGIKALQKCFYKKLK